jgi:hypothetical protein
MAEAVNARREGFQEAERCGKAKKDAIEAMRRVKFYLRITSSSFFHVYDYKMKFLFFGTEHLVVT